MATVSTWVGDLSRVERGCCSYKIPEAEKWGLQYIYAYRAKKIFNFFSFDIGDVVAHWGDVVAHWLRCGGSLAVYQTSGAEVPGSNQASPMHIDPGALQDACVIM